MSTVRSLLAIRTGYTFVKSPLLIKFLKRLKQLPKVDKRKTAPANKALVRAVCSDPTIDGAVKLGILLGFNGLLRCSEYCSATTKPAKDPKNGPRRLQRSDVRVATDRSYVAVRTFGKSDPFNHGPEMNFAAAVGDPLCVVSTTAAYLQWRDIKYSPTDPLLILHNGKFLTAVNVADALKKHAASVGLIPRNIGTHSLRYGGAFELVASGAPWDDVIARGRWRSIGAKRLAMQYASFSIDRTVNIAQRLRLDGTDSAQLFARLF